MKRTLSYTLAIILVCIGFVALTVSVIWLVLQPFDPALLEKYGSFVGGFIGSLFSLAGFLLLFEAITLQQRLFEKQQFESKFFDLLKMHRENVSEMKKRIPIKGDKYEEGRRVFVLMRKEFGEIIGIVRESEKKLNISVGETKAVNLAYLIFFYGVSETLFNKGQNQTSLLREKLENSSYDKVFLESVIQACCLCMDEENQYIRFNGNQVRLGHYYRHLFQVVKFVDQSSILQPKEKYFYLKTLRAQLSAHEQLILFYSVVSDIGRPWITPINYISQYRLIKNVPLEKGFTYDINPSNYFNIRYEDETFVRTKME
jgi:hypothetical protein